MQLYYGSSQIGQAYYGDMPINEIYRFNQRIYARMCTVTIVPTPSDATVTFTATGYVQSGNSITVPFGTTVQYSVSKSGYTTISNSVLVNNDITFPISLMNQLTFTINPTPSNATVTLTASGFTQVGNSIVVDANTTVSYSVSKTGYVTQSSSVVVNSNQTLAITLAIQTHTVTINTNPSDATVTFSTGTVSGHSCTVNYGTQLTYTVSKANYVSQSNTITVTSTQTINVTLSRPYSPNQVIFESSTAGTYQLTTLASGTYNIICVGGGGGGAGRRWSTTCQCAAAGGSGGYTNVNKTLPAATISINVGEAGAANMGGSGIGTTYGNNGGNSSVGSYASANGGGRGTAYIPNASSSATGGSGGTGSTTNGKAGEGIVMTNKTANGGASVYSGYGRGATVKTGMVSSQNPSLVTASSGGYVKVTFISY